MPHQHCTSFPDIAQEKSRANIEQKDKIVQNNNTIPALQDRYMPLWFSKSTLNFNQDGCGF